MALELPRTDQAPGIARHRLAESFASELDDLAQQRAKLLVSELVTNAVVHGRGRIELHAQLDRDRLLVEVIDEGPRFVPPVRGRDPNAAGGHGLHIVEQESSRWGIREAGAGVWFELQRQPAGAAPKTRCASSTESLVPSAISSPPTGRAGAGADSRMERARLAAFYGRVADTLERSADLIEQRAECEYRRGRRQSVEVELERAKRAREAARRARALCSRLT